MPLTRQAWPAAFFCRLPLLLLFACVGCARHYSGLVVDVHGRAVPFARVQGSGMQGGMITGERIFRVEAVADSDGKFRLIAPDPVSDFIATSPDSKRRGRVFMDASKPPVVITVR